MSDNAWHDFLTEAEARQLADHLSRETLPYFLFRLTSHDIEVTRLGDGRVGITVRES